MSSATLNNRHRIEWADPTGHAAIRNVQLQRAGLTDDRLQQVEDYLRGNPVTTSRKVSRGLGNMSRLQVDAAIEALTAASRIRQVGGFYV